MQPLVTVVIPAYNAQATLAETLRSLLAQSLTDWRAVVVDDGSTDSTLTIAGDFAWRDDRISVVRQENQGPAGARNRGMDLADGMYLHFLDADDWLLPLGLERLIQAAEWGGLGAACGSWTLHQGDGRAMGVTMPPADRVVTVEHLFSGNVTAPHAQIVRRDLVGDERFDASLPVVEDYEMWLRLASRGVRWSGVDDLVAAYRIRPGSLSKNPRLMLKTLCPVIDRATGDRVALAAGLRHAALFYATMEAMTDRSPFFETPKAMLRSALPTAAAFTPVELGRAAYWVLMMGFGVAPWRFASTADRWRPQLAAWWGALAGTSVIDAGIEALAFEAISPDTVAGVMLDGVPEGSPVVLAGAMGRNGRVIQRVARSRGVGLTLRDDRLPRAGIERLIDASSTVLIAPHADEEIAAKLPRGLRVVRWGEERGRLAGELLGALHGVIDVGMQAAGA